LLLNRQAGNGATGRACRANAAQSALAALCQSAAAGEKSRESPVCGGFGFHALMIVDETGVLRTRSEQNRRATRLRETLCTRSG
jgi:hypothetical protein